MDTELEESDPFANVEEEENTANPIYYAFYNP